MIRKIIPFVFLFILLAVAVVNAMTNEKTIDPNQIPPEKIPGLAIGVTAPDFELVNLEGKTVKLSQFKGKKVMLNFWATWCPPCKEEMPAIQKFYTEKGDSVQILAVNLDPNSNVKEFAEKLKVNFPILLDKNEEVMGAYKILTIPTTFFIDEKGIIINKYLGPLTVEQMKKYTDEL
ncbi:peroxiredoxin family protein [Robertmurraya kyonggiensis]|uniref:Redoxin domain-containing protein n=1 Tax=Robertmurraya kyonggiensis TaxID=1037680 RepID=A0A4U1D9L6_9BACI|nr:redoxin domain-containing protein [Robertmurraya kyonggiensis]TKC19245.1 redoxin domain-containing protein [Robertmurraya kyonggiensis]